MKVHDCKQRDSTWYKLRELSLTASNAQAIATQGKGLDTLILNKLAEYFSSREKVNYSNADIDRGNELEGEARTIYELETGNKVDQVGYIEHTPNSGCSPDGLIGEDGGVEIKCLSDKVYVELLLSKKIETKYIWQMQMQMLCAKREWIDFAAYNPYFKHYLWTERVFRDEDKIIKIAAGIISGTDMLLEKLEELRKIT